MTTTSPRTAYAAWILDTARTNARTPTAAFPGMPLRQIHTAAQPALNDLLESGQVKIVTVRRTEGRRTRIYNYVAATDAQVPA